MSGLSNFKQPAKVNKNKYSGSLLLEGVQLPDATSRYGEWRLNNRLKEIWRSRSLSVKDKEAVSGGDERHSDNGTSLFLDPKRPPV
jgi:hypothetical protein